MTSADPEEMTGNKLEGYESVFCRAPSHHGRTEAGAFKGSVANRFCTGMMRFPFRRPFQNSSELWLTRRTRAHALHDAERCALHLTERFTRGPAIKRVSNAPHNFVSLARDNDYAGPARPSTSLQEFAAQGWDPHLYV